MPQRPIRKIHPQIQKLLLSQLEKKTKRSFSYPVAVFLLCVFCVWLVYRSIHPLLPGFDEPPRLYSNQCQNDLRLVFTTALQSAQKSIYLVMFGLSDFAVLRTLGECARNGIKTTIYYDPSGSPRIHKKLRGVHLRPVQQNGLMHQKVLILDEDLIFIGSANMTSASLRMHDNLVVGLRSKLVAKFLLEHPPYTPGSLRAIVGGQDLELWLLPDPRGHVIGDLRRLMRNASRSIKIALFTFTHPGLCEELIAAKGRGVAVTLVVDLHSGLGASAKAVQQLRAAGVAVLFSQGLQLLHHKFLLIDDQTLISGSANWTKAAFYKNSDCILVLHQLTLEQKQFMKNLWARVVTEAQIQKAKSG